jgi:hypothetical protein
MSGRRVREQSNRVSGRSCELGPPTPLHRSEGVSPQDQSGGGGHILAKEGGGGANSDEGTETLVLCILR